MLAVEELRGSRFFITFFRWERPRLSRPLRVFSLYLGCRWENLGMEKHSDNLMFFSSLPSVWKRMVFVVLSIFIFLR